MNIITREMASDDVRAARSLLSQLGYEMKEEEVKRRYGAIKEKKDHAVFVAEEGRRVVAFLHLYERPAFDKPPEVVVQAIVVDQSFRGAGIGKAMMDRAERWALERGFSSVALTSSVSRSDAHSFYTKIGYEIKASSHLFGKDLHGIMEQTDPTRLANPART
jgi:GNAT superfamily N-acetyltransferase